MDKLEVKLKKEWETEKELSRFYDDLDDYVNYMKECIEQYKDLKKEIKNYRGSLEDFVRTLEFGYTNYKENKYVDFYWGNLTCTINIINNRMILSNLVEIWNDRYCVLINNCFDINEYLI